MKIYHEIGKKNICYRNAYWHADLDCPFHWHERIEIIFCKNNSFDVLIDGVNYTANPGDIVVIGEKIIHKFNISEDDTVTRLMQLPFRILLKNGVLPKSIKPLITREEILAIDGVGKQLEALFDLIENESLNENYENEPIIENLLSALYFLLMRHFSAESDVKENDKSKCDFYRIVSFVNDNFTKDINI